MQSYEAARSYFSFLSFLSWCVIIIGGIVAIVALAALGQMSRSFGGSPLAGIAGIVPGVAIMFAGFLGLVLVQIGRAGVDSAEYAQQSLKIAREQLEISRQGLKQQSSPSTYGEQKATEVDLTSATTTPSFGDLASEKKDSPSEPTISQYQGQRIEHRDGKFVWAKVPYDSLKEVHAHLDNLTAFAPETLKAQREKDAARLAKANDTEAGDLIEYNGQQIRRVPAGFVAKGTIYTGLDRAKQAIDGVLY